MNLMNKTLEKGLISIISFRKIELEDKDLFDKVFEKTNPQGSHLNFSNLYMWLEVFKYEFAMVDNFMVITAKKDGVRGAFFPQGEGDVAPILEKLRVDAGERGIVFCLIGLTAAECDLVEGLYPGLFAVEDMRDAYDYVYGVDKLADLVGNKLSGKRNHINYFVKNNDWTFEVIDDHNFAEMRAMNVEWCELYEEESGDSFREETCAVARALNNYQVLGLEGGLIRANGQVIAFTVGEIQNNDTFISHIEKAYGEIRGAYQIINREFARYIRDKYPQIAYINREEDMGVEGLRRAKESYYPDKMIEKFWLIAKQ